VGTADEGMTHIASDTFALEEPEHSKLGAMPQTHQPAQEDLPVRLERRLSEHDEKSLQSCLERWYDKPHTGTSLSCGWVLLTTEYKEPRSFLDSKICESSDNECRITNVD